ncbi:bifunctional riboflavin kinase/FMN adenylyltransferase [Fructobacillus sp. W13]|uniref:Riboflavin biosynthesis protein n=1 Tax=Fructobacillus apis TaxID=2935017 RepID=A0ABT0ZR84_9LACO|nr:bifunctional riboflavin kinase/FMN adenylyltransferase [Fructobacillus apis]MCO0832501.1 bifunctional riboflavin kinase/FMN adenylyltransferase [Fructobacillus apis]
MTELIDLHYPFDGDNFIAEDQVIAMGYFDGVHKGHQAVIKAAKAKADELGLPLSVLTYTPYPGLVFEKKALPWRDLTPIAEKIALLSNLGVDRVYRLNLTSKLAGLKPTAFVDNVLLALHAKAVVAGFDHYYGPRAEQADMVHLQKFAQGRFDVVTVGKQTVGEMEAATADASNGNAGTNSSATTDDATSAVSTDSSVAKPDAKIASRTIRNQLEEGNVHAANAALGRVHHTTGTVVHGDARGRTLGYPTINIWTPEREFLPGIGVYAVRVEVAGQEVLGMASIGRNITFGEGRPVTVEINLLDWNEMIYGEPVKVYWDERLRGEVAFESVDGLIKQLEQDEAETRNYFKKG